MTVSELRTWRHGLGLSQAGAAIALKVPLASYRQWETGRRRLPALLEMATLAVSYAAEIQGRRQATG